ncbi:MAG: Methionine synthase [Gammaproteobacteria bacterium]|nr:Methionine synthase [Gammaproteobacteria bacterium]
MAQFDFSEGVKHLSRAMTTGSDSVPFIAQMHEFSMRESGTPGDEFYTDAKKFVRGVCETAERFGFDTPSFIWDAYNVEAEALGCTLVKFKDKAPAIENSDPLIKTEKDLARLKAPDPYSSGRMPMVLEIMHEIKGQAGMTPLPGYCAPFTLASHVMTFENLIVQIQESPGFVHKVMSFLVDEVLAPYLNVLLKEFPDAPVADGSDAVASLPFITQDMLDEFALGYIERLQQQTIRTAICDNWWGDSYSDDLHRFWEQKLRATPPYLKVQDPDLFKVGVQPVIDYAKANNLPVVLGVDNNVFQNGPSAEIEMRIHEYMEAIEEIGKGALYLCSLSAVTPAENVEIAVKAAKQFRAGDRPYAGLRRAGTPEARGEAEETPTTVDMAAGGAAFAAAQAEATEEDQLLDQIFDAVLDQEARETAQLVEKALEKNMDVHEILNEGLIVPMDEVGDEFSEGKIFVPEMLMAARAMKAGLEVLRPILSQTGAPDKGKVMLSTVQGDVHDIGKNLVGMMLEGAGYGVVDLGVNKTPEEILDMANELKPHVVGLSALLTTSMPSMQKTVALFKEVKSEFPVIVGGAPVTQEFADVIEADGYGENAPMAVETVHRLVDSQLRRVV